jgi:hypothetical protein
MHLLKQAGKYSFLSVPATLTLKLGQPGREITFRLSGWCDFVRYFANIFATYDDRDDDDVD